MAEQSQGMSDEDLVDYVKLLSQFPEIKLSFRYNEDKEVVIITGIRTYKGRKFSDTKYAPMEFIMAHRFPGVVLLSMIRDIFSGVNHSVNASYYESQN